MTVFRVHLSDGSKVDVDAETPQQAEATAKTGRPGVTATKVKRVRS